MATASLLTRAECPASTYPPTSVERASAFSEGAFADRWHTIAAQRHLLED